VFRKTVHHRRRAGSRRTRLRCEEAIVSGRLHGFIANFAPRRSSVSAVAPPHEQGLHLQLQHDARNRTESSSALKYHQPHSTSSLNKQTSGFLRQQARNSPRPYGTGSRAVYWPLDRSLLKPPRAGSLTRPSLHRLLDPPIATQFSQTSPPWTKPRQHGPATAYHWTGAVGSLVV
jgi:hypothetical protein